MSSQIEAALRQSFKKLNRWLMIPLWRLGLGAWLNAWPDMSGRIMVLVHTGRKTGLRRLTPVNFAVVNNEVYCAAGFGAVSDWYRNITTNPNVEIWLPDGWWAGVAEDVTTAENAPRILREVLSASGIVAPLMGIAPKTMNDEEFAKEVESYRLVRINRTAARTGSGGPGDLAWVWPLSTFVLLSFVFPRRKSKK